MAKAKSLLKLSGTLEHLTFVEGKNGFYVRRKRGTVKEAKINDALAKAGALRRASSSVARKLLQAIEPYRIDFKDGTMWNRLVNAIYAEMKKNVDPPYASLTQFEIHSAYQLNRIADSELEAQWVKQSIQYRFRFLSTPRFSSKAVNSLALSFVTFYIAKHEVVHEQVHNIKSTALNKVVKPIKWSITSPECSFDVAITMLIVVGYENGEPHESVKSKAIKVLNVLPNC